MSGKLKPSPQVEPTVVYPNLERFLEQCNRESPAKVFRETKKKLEAVSGPRAGNAKKAITGLERVESLLGELFEVRLRLEDQARQAKMTRR